MYRIEQVPIETHVWTLEPNFLTQTDSGDILVSFYKIGHTIWEYAQRRELRFRLNVMDWPGAVERRKFFQVRAERFGGRVKICNLMSAAALSCPPFNTQCKNQRIKKPSNEIQLANPMSDVLCYSVIPSFHAKKKRKNKRNKSDVRCAICPRINSAHWLAWILQQEMPFYSMDV